MFALATWRLHGHEGRRDFAAAHQWLRKAAGKGHVLAARTRAHLIASGTGCRADPSEARRLLGKIAARDSHAAAQLDLLDRVPVPPAQVREVVNASPEIVLLRRFLAPEECRYLMNVAEPKLAPSTVVEPSTGRLVPHPGRTSYSCSFESAEADLVISRINRRIGAATATRLEWGEPLVALRYTPGQEYKLHMDAIPGAVNQRTWTALLYLNDGYGGGDTAFPDLGVTVTGGAGDALLFRSLDDEGRPDTRSCHAGTPVTRGVKWLATRWIRQGPYDEQGS
jgi:prolyl 4-hydroxylase